MRQFNPPARRTDARTVSSRPFQLSRHRHSGVTMQIAYSSCMRLSALEQNLTEPVVNSSTAPDVQHGLAEPTNKLIRHIGWQHLVEIVKRAVRHRGKLFRRGTLCPATPCIQPTLALALGFHQSRSELADIRTAPAGTTPEPPCLPPITLLRRG